MAAREVGAIEAVESLQDTLVASRDPQRKIQSDADGAGLSWATVKRAKKKIGVIKRNQGGALALVSGRRISDLDRLFFPLALPSIGGHGAEMRVNHGELFYWAKPLSTDLRRKLADVARIGSGIVVEDKDYSLALHYRKAPEHAEQLRRHIAAARTAFPAEPTELLLGKAMFEVKRPGINKGESIRKLMAHAPFSGRMPVFIGDDVTDNRYSRSCPRSAERVLASPDISRGSPGFSRIRRRYELRWNSLATNGRARV